MYNIKIFLTNIIFIGKGWSIRYIIIITNTKYHLIKWKNTWINFNKIKTTSWKLIKKKCINKTCKIKI